MFATVLFGLYLELSLETEGRLAYGLLAGGNKEARERIIRSNK